MISKRTKPIAHFIGIGGIGMSGLAQWFQTEGWKVSGSDATKSVITDGLKRLGIKTLIGHRESNLPKDVSLVLVTQAVPEDNPELRLARKRHIEILSYPQMLGRLTHLYETLAVAGAHGKSTTTSLLSLILTRAGRDPTVIVGTKLKEFGNRNFRSGRGQYLVLEADEYKASFLHYSPALAVLTNIDAEHLDFYKNIRNIRKAFIRFLAGVRPGGTIVLNRDDKEISSLEPDIKLLAVKNRLRVIWYSLHMPLAKKIKRALRLPGTHNVQNALAAMAAAKSVGIPEKICLQAIAAYRGAWRRMEYRGRFRGALVYDDYGHHPTEIRATLAAFRELFPNKKLLCVFQPHQADRLAKLFDDFQSAFDLADETLILPPYEVVGRDNQQFSRNSEALVRQIQKNHPRKLIFYLSKPENLVRALSVFEPLHRRVIIMMGAGNIVDLTNKFLVPRGSKPL